MSEQLYRVSRLLKDYPNIVASEGDVGEEELGDVKIGIIVPTSKGNVVKNLQSPEGCAALSDQYIIKWIQDQIFGIEDITNV